jgi:hypothetical protein
MLLGDFSTNSSRTWRPLKLLPCAELGCCRIAPACRMSHNIGETRRTRKCHCWISRPRHSSLFSRAFVQGCGKIDLTELAYGGGVSLGRLGLGRIFPVLSFQMESTSYLNRQLNLTRIELGCQLQPTAARKTKPVLMICLGSI